MDPMDIVLSSPSGAVLPDIFLSTSAEDSSVKTDKLYQLEPQSQASTSFVTFALNIQSNEDLALVQGGSRVLQIKATDYPQGKQGVETLHPLSLLVRSRNNPPSISGICWTNENRLDNPFKVNPQNICAQLDAVDGSTRDRYCRTPDTKLKPLSLDENKEAQFAICGQDIDSEDSLTFQYLAITRTGSGEFIETTGVPESTSEFFFNKPRAVNFAYTGSEVINSSTSKASTIGLFEWKPRGNVFRDQNTLVFSATDGKGVEGIYPPLAKSDFLFKHLKESILAVKQGGIEGEIVVNGVKYNTQMEDMGLYEDEVADVLNYILNSWGNKYDKTITEEYIKNLK